MIYTTKNIRIINSNIAGYMTPNQFGIKYGLAHSTINYWIKSGDIDAIRIGRFYYIPENAVPPKYKSRGRNGNKYYLCDFEFTDTNDEINSTSHRILQCLNKRRGKTVREIWKYFSDVSLTTIYYNLDSLMKKGLITNKRSSAK